MTSTRDHSPLSRLELVVLARLSSSKPPTERDVVTAVLEFASPEESPVHARSSALDALAMLCERGFVTEEPRRRGPPLRRLTDDGVRALRGAFGFGRTPTWKDIRDLHLPALSLGLQPGSKQATETLRNSDSVAAAVLRAELGIDHATTLRAICDALVIEALGLPPGPLTMARIQTHVLAKRAGVEAKGTPGKLAAMVAANAVRAKKVDKGSLLRALRRRWMQEVGRTSNGQSTSSAQSVDGYTLLSVVREAIPRIGPEGRYGKEKVFVSAIWHDIEQDRRLTGLSLDRFKRWLLAANRDGWLALARADLVIAMNPEQVAESEIEDRGAAFHFVLDQREGGPEAEWESHAQ